MIVQDLKEMNAALAFIKKASGFTRYTMPELTAVRLAAADGQLKLGWFDYETEIDVFVDADGDLAEAVVQYADLMNAVKVMGAKGSAQLSVEGARLRIGRPGSSTQVPLYSGELPASPNVAVTPVAVATGADFANVIAAVGSAVGTDDTLPMLTGVRLEANPAGGITAAATDRFRLVVADLPPSNLAAGEDFAVLVRGRSLTAFAKFAAKATEVQVAVGAGMIAYRSAKVQLSARLLDAEFPRFRQLLPDPDSYQVTFTVDAAPLSKHLKAVSAGSANVRLDVTAEGVNALGYSSVPDGGPTFVVDAGELRVNEPMTIALNALYLSQALAVAPRGEKPTVALIKPTKPMMIEWPGVKALLMPVRIPGAGDNA